jgi:hypothetical protein
MHDDVAWKCSDQVPGSVWFSSIYQHSSQVADEAIAAALDARLTERKSRPAPNVVGPAEGPTEPQLIAVEPGRSGKRPLTRDNSLERMTGIEPALSAWEADVLPLNYIRLTRHFVHSCLLSCLRRASNVPQASERRNLRLAHVERTEAGADCTLASRDPSNVIASLCT